MTDRPLPRELDTNAFYKSGVTTCNLQRALYDKLRTLMLELKWVNDPEMTYNAVPHFIADNRTHSGAENGSTTLEWSYDRKATVEGFPLPFKDILSDILKHHLVDLGCVYDFHIVFMDMWDGSEDCPWHWDGTDDSDIIMLAYVNDYQWWDPAWGGHLLVGQRDLSKRGIFSDFQKIEGIQSIPPQRRTLALVNNRNPRLVHKPEPLIGQHERKVFTAGIRLLPKMSFESSPSVTF